MEEWGWKNEQINFTSFLLCMRVKHLIDITLGLCFVGNVVIILFDGNCKSN